MTPISARIEGSIRQTCIKILASLFVDSIWIHRWWGCHRLPERSFRVEGRQFHVCARCTGFIAGLPLSMLALPLRHDLPPAFLIIFGLLMLDGISQHLAWRTSNNRLRFITGFGTGLTLIPSLLALGGF